MVDRGARNLILLSRSGVKSQAAKDLIRYLEGRHICVVTPAVDISDLVTLRHVLKTLEKTMPPIRGCIQATVALRVCIPRSKFIVRVPTKKTIPF